MSSEEEEDKIKFSDLNFNISKYENSKTFKEKVLPTYIEELKLSHINNNIKLIFEHVDNRITYHGRECTYSVIKLYSYQDYYIIFYIYLEGDEDDFFAHTDNILKNYDNLTELLDNIIKIIPKNDFNVLTFVDSVNILSANIFDIARFFKKFYGKREGKIEYMKYAELQFDELK
jgi:hypothetical protein